MNRRIIAVCVVLAVILTAGTVYAQMRKSKSLPSAGMGPGECAVMGDGMIEKFKTQLSLTDAQITQLKSIHEDFMTSTKDARDQLKTAMQQLRELWTTCQPNADTIKAKADEIDPIRKQIRDSAIDHAIQAYNVLTPEQQTKAQAIIKSIPDFCGGMGCCMGCICGRGIGMRKGAGPGAYRK